MNIPEDCQSMVGEDLEGGWDVIIDLMNAGLSRKVCFALQAQ